LRVGTGNVEIAGLFAPKPLAMSAAKDWTIDIETKGLPELKQLYKLYGAEDKVAARCWPEFGHNYNQVAREFMYHWFNKHLLGQDKPIAEQPFEPVPPAELSVYDEQHPRPKDERDALGVREYLTALAFKQMKEREPKDAPSLAEFRRIVGTALRVMIHDSRANPDDVEMKRKDVVELKLPDGVKVHQTVIGTKGTDEAVPIIGVHGPKFEGTMVLWIHPAGKASLFEKGRLTAAARSILDKGAGIVAIDAFQTGELRGKTPFPVDAKYAGFTYGYNRSVFAQRARDTLTAIRFAHAHPACKTLHVVGWEGTGPWVAAARGLAGELVTRTAVDLNQFRFENIKDAGDEMMLPGAAKFGGVPAFLALIAPHEVLAHNHAGTHSGQLAKAAYAAASAADKLTRSSEKMTESDVIKWLLK
jgi:hypothetical protein